MLRSSDQRFISSVNVLLQSTQHLPQRNIGLIIIRLLSHAGLCVPSLQKEKVTVFRSLEILEKVECGGGPVELCACLGAFHKGLE